MTTQQKKVLMTAQEIQAMKDNVDNVAIFADDDILQITNDGIRTTLVTGKVINNKDCV